MNRLLTVSEIRNNLHRVLGPVPAGTPVTPFLGQAFHEMFGKLTGPDPDLNFVRPLGDSDAAPDEMRKALKAHAFRRLVSPFLLQHHQLLAGQGAAVLEFWRAVESLCSWLVTLSDADRTPGRTLEEFRREVFKDHERDVERELHDPGWKSKVVVKGRIDALFHKPVTGDLCVGEIKLGAGVPEVDLCQAALYRLLLESRLADSRSRDPAMALIHFGSERREVLYRAPQLATLDAHLRELVGRLAGVVPEETLVSGSPPSSPGLSGQARLTFGPSPGEEELRKKVKNAFDDAGVSLKFSPGVLSGPSQLRFLASAGKGVTESQIRKATENLWLALKLSHRAQFSVVKGEVAIDVPRSDPQPVWWRDLAPWIPARSVKTASRFPAGVSVDGSTRWVDLAMPDSAHFLVAGTTGSGKSEWIRAMLASLMASNTPATLKLVLIDPKRTAFNCLSSSPFLDRPVVYPEETAVLEILDELIEEMERRYKLLSEAGVNDMAELEERFGRAPYPRLLCVCDEFYDIVAVGNKARQLVETRLTRLAGKSRAAGIHLVFATQRPSKAVVTGTIKANLTGRVALRATDWRESSIMLDRRGAENLLGKGDLLLLVTGEAERLQSPLVTTEELVILAKA